MPDKTQRTADDVTVRVLTRGDRDAVVALDSTLSDAPRAGFFEKRWAASARHPDSFTALGAYRAEHLVGFVLAQVLHGEFGTTGPVAVIDALGVAVGDQSRGIGGRLLQALLAEARVRGVREVRTQIAWDQSGLQSFFARCGFALAPRQVLERTTSGTDF